MRSRARKRADYTAVWPHAYASGLIGEARYEIAKIRHDMAGLRASYPLSKGERVPFSQGDDERKAAAIEQILAKRALRAQTQ